MKQLMFALLTCFLAFVIGCRGSTTSGTSGAGSVSDGSPNATNIIGVWTLTKANGNVPPASLDFEHTSDGKILVMGKEVATYRVAGDQFIITGKAGSGGDANEQVNTIKSLTADKLVLTDANQGEREYTRKK